MDKQLLLLRFTSSRLKGWVICEVCFKGFSGSYSISWSFPFAYIGSQRINEASCSAVKCTCVQGKENVTTWKQEKWTSFSPFSYVYVRHFNKLQDRIHIFPIIFRQLLRDKLIYLIICLISRKRERERERKREREREERGRERGERDWDRIAIASRTLHKSHSNHRSWMI